MPRVEHPPRTWLVALALTMVGGLCLTVDLQAQTAPAGPSAATQAPATSVTPLAHYVPRNNLLLYLEFDGLDAHAEAWQKTAAYKMLNHTPLGAMLQEVFGQLLERPLSLAPNRKVTGAELVTLLKHVAQKGCVLALNTTSPRTFVTTFVLRGGAAKEIRPISSRLLGMMMGESKPKPLRKGGRVLVQVPRGQTSGPNAAEIGWIWWPEKEDLVLVGSYTDADAIIAALDKSSSSAVEHPLVSELAKPEGSFVPVMTMFIDPSALPAFPPGQPPYQMAVFFDQLKQKIGVNRLDYRWGVDGDALMSVTRLAAPAPRKSLLAMFDQPRLDTKHLIPIPDGVDSFVLVSVSPAKVLDALSNIGAAATTRAKLDEFFARLKEQNRVDFEKDFLGNLGPKMAFYLAPGRSAATTDEAPEPAAKAGDFDPMAMLSSLSSNLPKPTVIAELKDPNTFGKALDAVMISVNKELKAKAIEKAAEEESEKDAGNRPGAPGGPGQFAERRQRQGNQSRGAGPGERSTRKRSSKDIPAPEFRLMPGSVTARSYRLSVPTDSPLKFGGPGVHPTIRMEDRYVAFSSSSEAAREAIDMIKKKDWKPSADVGQAISHVPADLILLAVLDPRETMPGLLASLPGTLQSQINTVIAMSAATPPAGAGNAGPGGMPGGPGGSGPRGGLSMSRGGSGSMSMAPGGPGSGGPGGYPGMSAPGGYPGMPAPGGQGPGGAGGSPADAMIELKVDPSKLPKAEELKALMFPGTLTVAVDDQSIRLISRESFPNLVGGLGGGAVGTSLLLPAIQAARARAMKTAGANAPGGPPSGQPGAAATPGAGAPAGPGAGASDAGPRGPRRGGPRGARPGGGGPGAQAPN